VPERWRGEAPPVVVEELALEPASLGEDRRGRERALGTMGLERALARLGIQGARIVREDGRPPRVEGARIAVSLSHSRTRVVAAAGRVASLGVDVCELSDAVRIRAMAGRFLARERTLCSDDLTTAACWASKEAGLKALGLGLLDGGVFDGRARVTVAALEPPRFDDARLLLAWRPSAGAVIAVAWPTSEPAVPT